MHQPRQDQKRSKRIHQNHFSHHFNNKHSNTDTFHMQNAINELPSYAMNYDEIKPPKSLVDEDENEDDATKITKTATASTTTDNAFEGKNISNIFSQQCQELFINPLSQFLTEEQLKQYPTPKLCVIGTESVGKSATIENLTKLPLFPTDTGVCTRCPIKVSLRPLSSSVLHSKQGKEKKRKAAAEEEEEEEEMHDIYTISYYDIETQEKHTFTMNTDTELRKHISTIFQNIEQHTTYGYDEREIEISIQTKRTKTQMEFIDIPGIVSYPEEKRKFTLELTDKYIQDPTVLVLCIAEAPISSLTGYFPISKIMEANIGKRSMIVLTKSDKVSEQDWKHSCTDRVLKTSKDLLSFQSEVFLVCNRDNRTKHTLIQQEQIENDFFQNSVQKFQNELIHSTTTNQYDPVLVDRYQAHLGIQNVITYQQKFFTNHVLHHWVPLMKQTMQQQIQLMTIRRNVLKQSILNEQEQERTLHQDDLILPDFIVDIMKYVFQTKNGRHMNESIWTQVLHKFKNISLWDKNLPYFWNTIDTILQQKLKQYFSSVKEIVVEGEEKGEEEGEKEGEEGEKEKDYRVAHYRSLYQLIGDFLSTQMSTSLLKYLQDISIIEHVVFRNIIETSISKKRKIIHGKEEGEREEEEEEEEGEMKKRIERETDGMDYDLFSQINDRLFQDILESEYWKNHYTTTILPYLQNEIQQYDTILNNYENALKVFNEASEKVKQH